MHNLLEIIKQAAKEAVEASGPMQFCMGKVIKADPLKVAIDQKLALGDSFLLMPDRLKGKLKQDDGVALLRVQGGQQYFILDKM